MRAKLFWRVGAGLAVVILLAATVVILLVTPRVEQETMRQIEQSLLARAQLLRSIAHPVLVAPEAGSEAEAALQQRLGTLGEATQTRFTVIGVDGRVLADSMGKSATMADPHGNRPEVVGARETGNFGTATRHSRTTGLDLRYLALAVVGDDERLLGYVRTALPTTWIEERRSTIWKRTALGAGIAGLLGLIVGLYLTHRLTRRLSSMADAAAAIAEGERPLGLPTTATDETGDLARALKRMDEQLEERRESLVRERNELSGILGSMLEGVVAVDREQRIVQMNRVARSMLNVGDEEVIGKHIADVTRVAEVCELLEAVIEQGEAQTQEIRVVEPPAARMLELHASPLSEGRSGLGGAVLVLHDVTELRRLEAVRRDFVANVSHELKTPLAAMQGLVETVVDDGDMAEETRTRFLQRALGQTGRLTALVKDLLSLSRAESEANLLERRQLDMRRPLREAADRLESVANRSELVLDLPADPVLVVGDEEGLRQIADNLLDNALKYTPEGGRISLRAWREGDEAILEVTDSGIGIEAEHLDRIFERFYRVDKARSRSLGGTGLGLAIVKHLVEAHGGRVEVESRPGSGSTFRVRLPAP